MKATFKDVAKLAGVSTQTVSRVTSGATNVAEKTRAKVLKAIEELDYVPNKGAQLLSRSKSKSVGLITLSLDHHGASLIANGIRQQAEKMHYNIVLNVVSEHSVSTANSAIKELKAQQVELIIINLPLNREQAEGFQANHKDTTFVFMDVPPDSQVHQVSSTHQQGAASAARLMIEQGRESFMLIAGPQDSSASSQRLAGWKSVVTDQNCRLVIEKHGDWKAASGYQLTLQALKEGYDFDAILVANDQMALGVLRAIHEFGRKIPSQIALAGFDDSTDSAYYYPPLSSVRQDFLSLGFNAVNLAIAAHHNPQEELQKIAIPTQLMERQSTGVKAPQDVDKHAIRQLLNELNEKLS
ncbi:LacI family DNA-binding transcriptional regulator [Marinomonas epiphytica]